MNEDAKTWGFESMVVGYETETREFAFSEEDIEDFIKLSGDANPLHVSDEFAKAHGFNGRLVHGSLLASKFSYLVGMVMPGIGGLYLSQELSFHKPVYIGEQFKVKGTVIRKSEATRIVEIKTEIFNSNGDMAVNGRALVKML